MLLELSIKDFALIDDLKLQFGKGLNIMTGETGAGKSIIIDSVNFVLGERSSKDVIRTGTDKTEVTAVFENVDTDDFKNARETYGLSTDDDVLILYRELNTSGRSICRINGNVVTTSVLKTIGNFLIDIHGQHQHQSLLNESYHIDLLDTFGGSFISGLKDEVKTIYAKVQLVKQNLKSITGDETERERKLSLLDYQVKEIDAAKLKVGEEEELIKEQNILNNSEKLYSVLSSCYSSMYENGNQGEPIFDKLGSVISELRTISGIDEKINSIYKRIEDTYYTLEDTISDIREYRDKIDFDPNRIDEVENRLDLINRLKRKYGKTIKDVLEYRDSICREIEAIENSEETAQKLRKQLEVDMSNLKSKSNELSNARKKIAKKLESRITNELRFLGMDKSKFEISMDILKKDGQISYSEKGMDSVSFLISTNPGEPVKPLSKIASGGETSRIMLAIKIVFADTDKIPCLIFDEIDTGISGRAAQAVAEKLSEVSLNHQVICVTHLPQIASMADTHFYIEKSVSSGKTRTTVKKLDYKSEVNELARMLGSAKITDLTLRHAEEMINMAKGIKRDFIKKQ